MNKEKLATDIIKYKPLLDALHVGNDTEIVEQIDILGSEFDPNVIVYRSGDSILHMIARLGRTSALRLLLERFDHNVNIEPTNLEGKRPLHEASQYGKYEIVELLIKHGVQVDPIKRADWTPLMMATTKVGSDAQKVVQILLHRGDASTTLQNKDGWNAFHLAAREGDVNILKLLHDYNPLASSSKSKNGRTPAHTAALHGKLSVLKFLHGNCGQCLNETDSCGATPLMDAARAGHLNVVSYLTEKIQCDIRGNDKMGRNVLCVAAHSGQTEIVSYLVKSIKMDPNAKDDSKLAMTPIHWAAKEGHLETIKILVEELTSDPNCKDGTGRTPLYFAISANHLDVTRYLLTHINIFDMKYLTMASSNPNMCSLLEETFASWKIKLYISTSDSGT